MSCPDGWGRKIAERLTKSLNYGAKYQRKKGEHGEKRGWGKGTTLCVFWMAFTPPHFSYRAIAFFIFSPFQDPDKEPECQNCHLIEMGSMACYQGICPQCGRPPPK